MILKSLTGLRKDLTLRAGVVEWLMAPGCKPGGLTPYGGSNPPPCTTSKAEVGRMKYEREAATLNATLSAFRLHPSSLLCGRV